MLTNIVIEENKNHFIELINSIDRVGFNKSALLNMLEQSDFYTAPASTKYHNDMPGGLCDHCIKVYNFLCTLNDTLNLGLDENSMKIVGLLHDMSKIGLYTKAARNVKHYCTQEEYEADPKAYKAFDELGNYKWVAEQYYTVVDDNAKFIYGTHEETCEYLAHCYVPLKRDESIAILHHHGKFGIEQPYDNIYVVFRQYPLAYALFMADTTSMVNEEVI